MTVKRFLIHAVLFFFLAGVAFAQTGMTILGPGESYDGQPDGVYGEYDYLNEYIASIYYVKDGQCQKEERRDRYGKIRALVNYRNGMPGDAEFFTDQEDFIRELRDSMDSGSRKAAFLLLACLVGLLLTRGLFGLGIWTAVYFVICLVILEGLFNIVLKSVGFSYTSSFFNGATVLQMIFFLPAAVYLGRGIFRLFAEKREGLFFILIGIFFTLLIAFLSLASFYDHWGLEYMLVTHVKSFLFVVLFSLALMVKIFLLRWKGIKPGQAGLY